MTRRRNPSKEELEAAGLELQSETIDLDADDELSTSFLASEIEQQSEESLRRRAVGRLDELWGDDASRGASGH